MPNKSENQPPASPYLEAARHGEAVMVRPVGLGNMNISLTMKDFVRACLDEGFRHFALDLTTCEGMDSTFMGTIIAINYRINERGGWLCLTNVSEENQRLLRLLGVWGLVQVINDTSFPAVEVERLLPGGDPTRRMELIQQAHKHLVAIDERNREKFGAFLEALETEMSTIKQSVKDEPASDPDPDIPSGFGQA